MKIPFQDSLRVTVQNNPCAKDGVFWFIVRGAENIPVAVGDMEVPKTARLVQYVQKLTMQPLDKLNVVETKGKAGLAIFWTLQVASGNLNFLEGCVRAYFDNGPKMLLSSGTEDYFDSAFYFVSAFSFFSVGLFVPPSRVNLCVRYFLKVFFWRGGGGRRVWKGGGEGVRKPFAVTSRKSPLTPAPRSTLRDRSLRIGCGPSCPAMTSLSSHRVSKDSRMCSSRPLPAVSPL